MEQERLEIPEAIVETQQALILWRPKHSPIPQVENSRKVRFSVLSSLDTALLWSYDFARAHWLKAVELMVATALVFNLMAFLFSTGGEIVRIATNLVSCHM